MVSAVNVVEWVAVVVLAFSDLFLGVVDGAGGAKPSEGGWGLSFAFMGEFGADEPNWTLPTGRFRTSSIASGMLQRS